MGRALNKQTNLKFLVPNTNGPFVGNPVSMLYEYHQGLVSFSTYSSHFLKVYKYLCKCKKVLDSFI